MNEMTNIDEIIKTARIQSTFQGVIADVEFDDMTLYFAVKSVFHQLKNQFTRINHPQEFVQLLQTSIMNAFIYYNYDAYSLHHTTHDAYELGDLKILSCSAIGFLLERIIKKTSRFRDLEFQITPYDHSFDELNEWIKEKYIQGE